MKKTVGGDRLGSGSKIEVDLSTFNRSTHDQGYVFRSTMSAGTLVPFCLEIGLPGTTMDIVLDGKMLTHPTIGPLFGSYKFQMDFFEIPFRLYNSYLHNNRLNIGLKMSDIKMPVFTLTAPSMGTIPDTMDNTQINPSCILAYLGVRGIGFNGTGGNVDRKFNACYLLAYWEIYKNYYANKQETIGFCIHTPRPALILTVTTVDAHINGTNIAIPPVPTLGQVTFTSGADYFRIFYTGTTPLASQVMVNTTQGRFSIEDLSTTVTNVGSNLECTFNFARFGSLTVLNWEMITRQDMDTTAPIPQGFSLDNIDKMRDLILTTPGNTQLDINTLNLPPYNLVLGHNTDNYAYSLGSQEGLGIKTYQSDLFNNWIRLEWIDGPGGINEITALDTTGGTITVDAIILANKVFNMLNRIAVSGGSYRDWVGAVYQDMPYGLAESPVYCGGLIKELIFQEVVSNSASTQETGQQPLGTLAGKGTLSSKHKGGQITIHCKEPSIIMGLASLTPRIDYSQGNMWHSQILTMDDFHKPGLDEIGWQDLITEQMAWWDTHWNGTTWVQRSAGKQPAWLNYQTNVNRTYGNFAIKQNEMFMTLNRDYNWDKTNQTIGDLTTYIDPAKYNQIFAMTRIDAQNFWCQIAVDITSRRLMSAKQIPNL